MSFKTINIDLNDITLENIDSIINTVIYKKYYNKKSNNKENTTQYTHRINWISDNFPTYEIYAKNHNTHKSYIGDIASFVGWQDIKEDIKTLRNYKEQLINENEKKQLINNFKEIWDTTINDTKYQLQSITQQIQKTEKQLKNTNNAESKKALELRLDELWEKHNNIVINKFPKLQDKARTNLGLTNTYKDTSVDKLEVEQKGELTLNQNINNKTQEELDEEYENRFKHYMETITANNQTDV
ncbi:hypothetical protein [Methanobrevibacter sp.]